MHDTGVHTVAVSPDGRKLVAGYLSSRAQIWDLTTGMPQGAPLPHAGDIVSAQLSADGSFALIGDWEGARVWDVATGQLRYPMLEHQVREDTVVGPVLSPDGRSIVTRSPFTGIQLWDDDRGRPTTVAVPEDDVKQALLSPDGRNLLIVSKDGSARLQDAASGFLPGVSFQPAIAESKLLTLPDSMCSSQLV